MDGEPGIAWLLRSNDPSIRYFARAEFAGVEPQSSEAERAKNAYLKVPASVHCSKTSSLTEGLVFTHTKSGWVPTGGWYPWLNWVAHGDFDRLFGQPI